MFYFPIIGAAILGGGVILEKIVLRKKKINIKLYQAATFLGIVLILLPFLYFFWKLESAAYTGTNLFIFGLVIVFALIANVFTFYSMKWEKVSNLEPAKLLEPLFTIIIAIIFSFFTVGLYERNLQVVIPALVAGLALVVLHIRKHHLDFNRYFVAAIIGSVFFALELVTTRLILDHYSPTTFYFIRCLIIFLITMLIFRPSLSKLGAKNSWLILLTAGFWVAYRIIVYYGYINLGVIFTTLMVMLAPVFVFTFARIFLKEKITWRNILSSVIIVGAVVYTIFA